MNKNNGRLVFLQSGADSRSTLGADSQGFPRLVLTTRKAQALTPRPYLLFFRYFNFVLVVLRQFWHQSKHRSVAASHSKSRTRKNHQKKKKKKTPLRHVFSTRELSLSFFYLVQESFHSVVFPSTKKKKKKKERDPRKTHHSPAAKTHKINTHRHKAQHLTSFTSRQKPKTQHLTLNHRR